MAMTDTDVSEATNFIKNAIAADLAKQGSAGPVVTRFPPEPNGYLHIGHAKAICLNFTLADDYENARCHLRFDDTNPEKEKKEFIDSIKQDIEWLGFAWGPHLYHASSYFDQLYTFAVELVERGKAYVCSLSSDQIREYRGTLTSPGKNSPFRERTVAENLALLEQMKEGRFANGEHVLRAKIDMSSGNLNMRDPVIYRIKHATHPITGDKWCIYPMYDFTHCLSDSIEHVTHSLCTLEFEDHRPLYDWFLDNLSVPSRPRQIEFARLELSYCITSKRKLRHLVESKTVSGWDDPRMMTIQGLRRRGVPASALRKFCDRIGVAKRQTVIDMSMLDETVRDDLNETAARAMCVSDPLLVVLTNVDPDHVEQLVAANHPQSDSMGHRQIPFARELYIDRSDFCEDPPKKYFRLAPGKEVRLRYGYVIKCCEVVKDASGQVTKLECTVDFDTLGKKPEGRKVKGVIHWVSKDYCVQGELRLYDRLFAHPSPASLEKEGRDFAEALNPNSLTHVTSAKMEPSLRHAKPEQTFQFERMGYFCADRLDHCQDRLCFNRVVELRDVWQ